MVCTLILWGQQLAPPPPVHGFNFYLLQPFLLGYAPPQGYSFPYGGLQGPGLPLGHSVPPVHGMPQMGLGALQPYNGTSSPFTPVQVGEGIGKGKRKVFIQAVVPLQIPFIPMSSTAGVASWSTALLVPVAVFSRQRGCSSPDGGVVSSFSWVCIGS